MAVKTIALATYDRFPDVTSDDQLLVEQLNCRQIEARPVVWNRPHSWSDFDAVIIRSCWDYHLKPAEFVRWIRSVEALDIPLWNQSRLVEWNIDKVYLESLQELGARVVPTISLERSSPASLTAILEAQNWEQAVIKPSISASAFRTRLVSRETAMRDQISLKETLISSGALIQQFVPEVRTNGEWSFIFFAGEFSHAVLKQPKKDDFRTQAQFGGCLHPASPSMHLIEQSQQIVDLVGEPFLFARVDGIEINGELYLMELELIEPVLFLQKEPRAAQRFADAIASLL